MNVLVIGGGGREHALCWKLAQSPQLGTLHCAPGNAGIAEVAAIAPLDVADHDAVVAFCREQEIGLVVVGPEQPLVDGLVDTLRRNRIHCFGPMAAAAQLEGSKGFTKELCRAHAIPTAAYERFDDAASAHDYVATQALPIVIKADGLAAGKGVVIAETRAEAAAAIDMMFDGGLGDAGASVVIEEFLTGEEASLFALVDGATAIPFGSAQDHKRVSDGDRGPNTGGMGAYSPAPVLTRELEQRAMREIIEPTARAMASAGMPFHGVLYAGLMLTDEGPKLIEYNARFGDPECQVLMARLEGDLLEILLAVADGRLWEIKPRWKDEAALVVVMAANGYPGTAVKGSEIKGTEAAAATGAIVFHAGTRRDGDRLLADGGRVLGVTALGASVTEAQRQAYEAVDRIDWPGGFCRRDIGWRAVEREKR